MTLVAAPRSLRLVLCDDHLMLMEGMAAVLARRGHLIEAMTPSPHEVVEIVASTKPHVCVLDVSFPTGDGCSAAAEIRRRSPNTRILILSGTLTPDLVRRCIEVGVHGVVRKDSTFAEIVDVLESLDDAQVSIEASVLREAMTVRSEQPNAAWRGRGPFRHLTHRERDVLRRMLAGDDTTAISGALHISRSTARSHVQNVLAKLAVHSRLQAVALVMEHGGPEVLDE